MTPEDFAQLDAISVVLLALRDHPERLPMATISAIAQEAWDIIQELAPERPWVETQCENQMTLEVVG